MTEYPLRRAQLVAPAGPGSIQTSADGVLAIVCGVDHWIDKVEPGFDSSEFKIIDEWRLSEELGVNYFVRPPDHREPFGVQRANEARNLNLRLPALRFPRYHYCRNCHYLSFESQHRAGHIKCISCSGQKVNGKVRNFFRQQMPFIAMCESGHIQDFPFNEWVHKSISPSCDGTQLKVSLTGGVLEGNSVTCTACGQKRSFRGIFSAAGDKALGKTFLSLRLDPNHEYLCRGAKPWLDDFEGDHNCNKQLIGGLTGAINVYYPYTESALFLPKETNGIDGDLLEAIQMNGPQVLIPLLKDAMDAAALAKVLIERESAVFTGFTEQQLADALQQQYYDDKVDEVSQVIDDWHVRIKAPEYKALVSAHSVMPSMLKMQKTALENYGDDVKNHIAALTLVTRLRETRVLTGFGRIKPNPHISLAEKKALLRRGNTQPRDWLPAYEVYGEGIFLDLNNNKLVEWSQREDVQKRVDRLRKSDSFARDYPNHIEASFLPRLVLLHTLAHVLINQLIFDCGYTAASLRERLYCTDIAHGVNSMNGLLIYTASGDSEGSMGGLVRMGEFGYLDRTFESALDHARFCSSDPICMELGEQGQGPNSMNLAGCHSCAMVPETSCELFNQYLDRGLLIGTTEQPQLAYFA